MPLELRKNMLHMQSHRGSLCSRPTAAVARVLAFATCVLPHVYYRTVPRAKTWHPASAAHGWLERDTNRITIQRSACNG